MTIKDIAKESGYSIGTVSRVLNKASDVSEHAKIPLCRLLINIISVLITMQSI